MTKHIAPPARGSESSQRLCNARLLVLEVAQWLAISLLAPATDAPVISSLLGERVIFKRLGQRLRAV
jgi:hypothetical protein